jgi:hypothetical protein
MSLGEAVGLAFSPDGVVERDGVPRTGRIANGEQLGSGLVCLEPRLRGRDVS